MRKSLEDLNKNLVKKAEYAGLPEELMEYCYWLADAGTCIMCVPECLLKENFGSMELWEYEVPIPVRYVLDRGWKFFEGYVVVQAEYDNNIGVVVPEEYYDY